MQPELNNRLVAVANQVLTGMVSQAEAEEIIVGDESLTNLADEQLWALIEEAERYWRGKLVIAAKHPQNLLIHPMLITSCAESRLRALGQIRRGADAAAKPALDQRMAQWISRTAHCMLANGMAYLLLPDYKRAWETFKRAEIMASALPDFGNIRLRELMWAAYGQYVASRESDQSARQQMQHLLSSAEYKQEAQVYLPELQDEFTIFSNVFQQRHQFLKSQASNNPPPEAPKPFMLRYVDLLNSYMRRIRAGELQLDEAKRLLLEEVDFSQLSSGALITSSALHIKLAESAPQQAVLLAELNHAVASVFEGDEAEYARTACSEVLGVALTGWAKENNYDDETFRRAILYLETALESLEQEQSRQFAARIAQLLSHLAICFRATGDFERAAGMNLKAIERWKVISVSDKRAANQLAMAYGNLGDVQEKLGDAVSAFGNHYQAFEMYLEAKDLRNAQRALFFLSRLSMRAGRSDDAISALEKMAALRVGVADLGGAVEAYLSLGENRFRVGQLKEALEAFQRAEDLLKPVVSAEQPEKKYRALFIDALIWRGTVLTLLYKHFPDAETAESASQQLDEARIRSMGIQDESRYAKAILQSANLFRLAGHDDMAESHLNMLFAVNVSPTVEARSAELKGAIRVAQRRYPEAVEYLQRALETYPPEQADRKMATLDTIGQAYEGAGQFDEAIKSYEAALEIFEKLRLGLYEESRLQFMGAARELYERLILLCSTKAADPIRALHWLEKSKSRTFAETMGLSLLPLRNLPDAVRPDWQQEQQLLDHINDLRSSLFSDAKDANDSLATQKELHETLRRLNALWDKMAVHCGEYVALRRGSVISWDALQRLLNASPSTSSN